VSSRPRVRAKDTTKAGRKSCLLCEHTLPAIFHAMHLLRLCPRRGGLKQAAGGRGRQGSVSGEGRPRELRDGAPPEQVASHSSDSQQFHHRNIWSSFCLRPPNALLALVRRQRTAKLTSRTYMSYLASPCVRNLCDPRDVTRAPAQRLGASWTSSLRARTSCGRAASPTPLCGPASWLMETSAGGRPPSASAMFPSCKAPKGVASSVLASEARMRVRGVTAVARGLGCTTVATRGRLLTFALSMSFAGVLSASPLLVAREPTFNGVRGRRFASRRQGRDLRNGEQAQCASGDGRSATRLRFVISTPRRWVGRGCRVTGS
jgi:hypothetical protein